MVMSHMRVPASRPGTLRNKGLHINKLMARSSDTFVLICVIKAICLPSPVAARLHRRQDGQVQAGVVVDQMDTLPTLARINMSVAEMCTISNRAFMARATSLVITRKILSNWDTSELKGMQPEFRALFYPAAITNSQIE